MDLFNKFLLNYYFYVEVFSILESNKLCLYRTYDYIINLELKTKSDYESLYGMSKDKFLVLKKYLKITYIRDLFEPLHLLQLFLFCLPKNSVEVYVFVLIIKSLMLLPLKIAILFSLSKKLFTGSAKLLSF